MALRSVRQRHPLTVRKPAPVSTSRQVIPSESFRPMAHHLRRCHSFSLDPHADWTVLLAHVVRVFEVLLPRILHAVEFEGMPGCALLPRARNRERACVVL